MTPTPTSPLRIHFDLTGQEPWHRAEWERLIAGMSASGTTCAQISSAPSDADCIIATSTRCHFGAGGRVFGYRGPRAERPPRFVWDSSDQPAGREPGFYCSLPRPLFDPRRHRTLCYPLVYNECVRPFALEDARKLYGFMGGVTSGLRSRLVAALRQNGRPDEMEVTLQNGPWQQMFDRSGLPVKQQFAAVLRRTRFVLCPRGNGVGSVRLFETMRAARVPVIISDEFVPPTRIDWDQCSIRIRERDVASLPRILRERTDDWPRLAINAATVWEENFSEQALLGRMAAELTELMQLRAPESALHLARLGTYWASMRARRSIGGAVVRLRRLYQRQRLAPAPACPPR